MAPSMDLLADLPATAGTTHTTRCTIHHKILDQISEIVVDTKAVKTTKADKVFTETTTEVGGYQQNNRYDQRNGVQNRYDNNRFDNRRQPNKYQHYKNQPKAQVIFEYANQSPMELMQTVRNFITFMKANSMSREHFKMNKLPNRNFSNEVSESEIHSSSLDQVQQVVNEDTDLVFDALVTADYIDKAECKEYNTQQQA